MEIYTFPRSRFYGDVFAIVKTLSGTYVCPDWHPVPDGTTRDQIRFFEADNTSKKQVAPSAPKESKPKQEWTVNGSKAGVTYIISDNNGSWSCTCPSNNFHRGDCKHIKAKKAELFATLAK